MGFEKAALSHQLGCLVWCFVTHNPIHNIKQAEEERTVAWLARTLFPAQGVEHQAVKDIVFYKPSDTFVAGPDGCLAISFFYVQLLSRLQ